MNKLHGTLRLFGRQRRSAARAVRALSGLPAGVRRSRRGTVLVLILGALALIAVLTIVYVSVGQSDRRASAVALHRDTVHAAGERIADYIADVIARGAFNHYVDGDYTDSNGTIRTRLVRLAADYPFTDDYRWSILSPANPANLDRKFDPAGGYSTRWTVGGPDPRRPYTPFLSSTEPTIELDPGSGAPIAGDWTHISNLAPNGLFVNLWNLAPVIGGVRYSAFDAQSTFNVPSGPAAPLIVGGRIRAEMSYGLTLLDDDGNPTDPATFPDGTPADLNVPAHFTMFQRQLFRPARGPAFYPNDPAANSPANHLYASYQFADADGDGFFDSRWFELIDASDPLAIRSLLPGDDRFRWFAAARVIDLSALVNVNTAMDFLRPPGEQAGSFNPPPTGAQVTPLGAYPDVDLRRLLVQSDQYLPAGSPLTAPLDYTSLKQPVSPQPNDFNDYGGYNQNPHDIGDFGYKALLYSRDRVAPAGPASPDPMLLTPVPTPTADQRALDFASFARASGTFAGGNVLLNGRFGVPDLVELLTYWTANNPAVTSRLEHIIGGRAGNPLARYSPLRDNRGLDLELWTHAPLWNYTGLTPPLPNPQPGGADVWGFARILTDIRHLLTSLNSSRPLRPAIIRPGDRAILSPGIDERVNAHDALRAATSPTAPDPHPLFRAYCDALLPHSAAAGAWDSSTPTPERTLSYGHSAELALRIAGHLAANMIDRYDTNHDPGVYTLLIDADARANVAADPQKYPWWSATGDSGKLDIKDDARLGSSASGVTLVSPAINISGIEAQPFLAQVAVFCIYTDAPATGVTPPGDDDYSGDPLDPGEITIDGTPNPATNSDFLGQVFAFQLTNPFDVDIKLTRNNTASALSLDQDFSDYYVEFAGQLYKLAEVNDQNIHTEIELKAGETRVFYALSHSLDTIINRWRNVDSAAGVLFERFISHQLGLPDPLGATPIAPIRIGRMDSTTGASDPLGGDMLTAGSDKRAVYLWRAMRQETPAPNRTADILLDRLRDPAPAGEETLDRRIPDGNHDITGTISGPEGEADNTGFTTVLWGYLKRRDNPGATIPLGAIPAYCVEAKWGAHLSNVRDTDGASPSALSHSDFTGGSGGQNAGTEFLSTVSLLSPDLVGNPSGPHELLIPTLTREPKNKTGDTIPSTLMGAGGAPGVPYSDVYPEIFLDNNRFERTSGASTISVLRVADMLLPLGVGPCHDPSITTDEDALHPGRITLSEALALALNYSTPTNSPADPYRLYYQLGDPDRGAIDRGHLVLNRFIPFEDNNGNLTYEGPGSAAPTGTDVTRFPHIPLALHLFDTFTTLPSSIGNLTRGTPGVVNINTAPRRVMNLLPLAAPTHELDAASGGVPLWDMWKGAAGIAPPATFLESTSDIAASMVAYRDRTQVIDRMGYATNFQDSGFPGISFDPVTWDGRWQTTQIPGLRSTPGFSGRGELLAITDPSDPATGSMRVPIEDRIDALAFDDAPSGGLGTNLSSYRNAAGTRAPAGIPDAYAEKLIVASGLMNTVTTRSDMFAVWFIVHGYQPSDTQDLHPKFSGDTRIDPLTPSVAKRYLMVVDRSNVERLGQKPRIVLLTELPLTP